jgi:uridine kinase
MSTFVVGVAGGTGSGKTTVAKKLLDEFKDQPVRLIPQDAYYKDLTGVSLEERAKVNYDHPFAFDNDLLAQHLDELIIGKSIRQPIYNYHTHSRSDDTLTVEPATIVLVEGILVLEDQKLRERMNIKVYVDTDADERFIRRLKRDLIERGRSIDSVIEQYLGSVRPMHLQFIEPTKRYADVIVPEGGANHVAIDLLASKIRAILGATASKEG